MAKTYSPSRAKDAFMNGHCRSFACALQKQIGGAIKSLHRNGREMHVYVTKNGAHYDVGGKRSHAQMILDMQGTLEHAGSWKEQPVDLASMKTNPRMVENANNYINGGNPYHDSMGKFTSFGRAVNSMHQGHAAEVKQALRHARGKGSK